MNRNLAFVAILTALLPCNDAQGQDIRVGGTGLGMLPKNLQNPSADAISDAQLQKLRNASTEKPVFTKPVAPRENPYSLLSLSCFLDSGGTSVILPKGCVVFCPPDLESKMVTKPSANLTPWSDFLMMNRNWIRCIEVTDEQIAGRAKISEESLQTYRKSRVLVIATLRGSPVTVLQFTPKP